MPGPRKIAIYGAGGFGREVAWLAECLSPAQPVDVVCFVDDRPENYGQELNGIPVWNLDQLRERQPDSRIACAIGSPRTREQVAARCRAQGFGFATLVHPRASASRFVAIGDGSIICQGSILTVNIEIGEQVHVNLNCTIGHDCRIGACTTLAPGVHVSGNVHIGRRVYIGTGAVIINGTQDEPLTIGDDSVIGAGACVTRPIASGMTAVGVPARARL